MAPTPASNATRWLALCVFGAAAAWPASAAARTDQSGRNWPFELAGAQYAPVDFVDLAGWSDDDHLQALKTFRVSCGPIAGPRNPPPDSKALGGSLREPCLAAKDPAISDPAKARSFFEKHFLPLRVSKLGDEQGFVTGYFEPVLEGSRTQSDAYPVPVYRRPSNLFVRGRSQASPGMPNGGEVFRKIGRRKLVPYYDRGQIEDGAIAGRGLEIAWLKNQTDLLFTQIQGSARIHFEDGGSVRINYDSHNGFGYTPVGRALIERGIIPREQMSMQRIRQWMEENPDGANELRRTNRSYVFFREVQLPPDAEAVGAQGVSLTAGRSIAVDKALHVYGTPFFIEGELPIETEISKTPFRRLMVAQDTGSAIVGPARADIYFGAGAWAGQVSGRVKQPARFVMLVPKALDPVEAGRSLPLPEPRPSELIAKLFPQSDPAKETAKPAEAAVAVTPPAPAPAPVVTPAPAISAVAPPASKETTPAKEPDKAATFIGPPAPAALVASTGVAAAAVAAKAVPLPEPRPEIKAELKTEAKPPRRERRRVRPHRHRFFWQ